MRKLIFCAVTALILASCGKDTTSPNNSLAASVQSDGSAAVNGAGNGPGFGGGLFRLPDNLKLTADQKAAIKAAMQASKGDRAALKAKIDAILTPAQKAWLLANAPKPCPANTTPLTDAQKTQIKSLRDGFQQANKADLDAVRAVMQQARAAHQAGKTRADLQSLFATVKPAMDRLQAARQKLQADISAVLTPEQRAARCHGFGGGAGRRGGFGGPAGPGGPQGRRGWGGEGRGFGYRGTIS